MHAETVYVVGAVAFGCVATMAFFVERPGAAAVEPKKDAVARSILNPLARSVTVMAAVAYTLAATGYGEWVRPGDGTHVALIPIALGILALPTAIAGLFLVADPRGMALFGAPAVPFAGAGASLHVALLAAALTSDDTHRAWLLAVAALAWAILAYYLTSFNGAVRAWDGLLLVPLITLTAAQTIAAAAGHAGWGALGSTMTAVLGLVLDLALYLVWHGLVVLVGVGCCGYGCRGAVCPSVPPRSRAPPSTPPLPTPESGRTLRSTVDEATDAQHTHPSLRYSHFISDDDLGLP